MSWNPGEEEISANEAETGGIGSVVKVGGVHPVQEEQERLSISTDPAM